VGASAELQSALERGTVFEEFHFVDMPAPLNGVGAVLSSRYIFNTIEKMLFATGTLPVLFRNHGYAEHQDDLTYAQWHRKRGMTSTCCKRSSRRWRSR